MTTKKKRKQKPLLVELRYHQLPLTEEGQRNLDDAFAILFDETLRRIKEEPARKQGS
ncbi:MAG: hypothetical protein HYT61_03610 [Candidatus Yanofskybacteria bacterium]|nr:hypothetical protein [Candidatus Yanofskybacteria bacterium]